MRPQVVPATKAHFAELAIAMREDDRAEIIGMGSTVAESLALTAERSMMTRTVLLAGCVVAAGGVGGQALGGTGQPWMLTTGLMDKVPVFMAKEARRQIGDWFLVFDRLESYVDARYFRACGFLSFLGFKLDPPQRAITGIPVRRFWMERGHG